MKQVAVLVSGTGSILEAMIGARLPIAVVAADRPCRGLEIAGSNGIATELVDRHDWGGFGPGFDREGYTKALTAAIEQHHVDAVAMAGFGTVLGLAIHDAFPGRILNTHPALLPAFPGWHAVEDALAAGVSETGCTVHVATLEMDAGPILEKVAVPVLPGDDAETLHERIKTVERELYPHAIAEFLAPLADDGVGASIVTQESATLTPESAR